MNAEKSFWHTVPGILAAVAGVVTALTGLIAGLHQVGLFGPGTDNRAMHDDAREVLVLAQQMREQIATERARLEALRARIEHQAVAAPSAGLATLVDRVGTLNSAAESPNAQVSGILLDPSVGDGDKVTLSMALIMKNLDDEIERAARRVNGIPPSPTHDVELMKLKRMIDKRAAMFEQASNIISKYDDTARAAIEKMNR